MQYELMKLNSETQIAHIWKDPINAKSDNAAKSKATKLTDTQGSRWTSKKNKAGNPFWVKWVGHICYRLTPKE